MGAASIIFEQDRTGFALFLLMENNYRQPLLKPHKNWFALLIIDLKQKGVTNYSVFSEPNFSKDFAS